MKSGPTNKIENSAVSIIDADGALGIHVGPMAMKLAIKKAKAFGIGCVIVKNAGHLGGAGYHANLAAKEGCIGQVKFALFKNVMNALKIKSRLVHSFTT